MEEVGLVNELVGQDYLRGQKTDLVGGVPFFAVVGFERGFDEVGVEDGHVTPHYFAVGEVIGDVDGFWL